MMQPLIVTCRVFNSIASDGYLPLDSISASLWVREHYPEKFYHNSVIGGDNELIEAELPIARIDNGNGWYYACSFYQASWIDSEVTHWHKRHNQTEQARYVKSGQLNLAKGKTKSYRMPLFKLLPDEVLTWYMVGDMDWLTSRLPLITSIGKKRDVGPFVDRETLPRLIKMGNITSSSSDAEVIEAAILRRM
jgi:hypothetical protein